jgi:hypothetical protein
LASLKQTNSIIYRNKQPACNPSLYEVCPQITETESGVLYEYVYDSVYDV